MQHLHQLYCLFGHPGESWPPAPRRRLRRPGRPAPTGTAGSPLGHPSESNAGIVANRRIAVTCIPPPPVLALMAAAAAAAAAAAVVVAAAHTYCLSCAPAVAQARRAGPVDQWSLVMSKVEPLAVYNRLYSYY